MFRTDEDFIQMRRIILYLFLILLSGNRVYTQSVDHWEGIVEASDIWKYLIPVSELPVEWTNPGFDDSMWSSGPGGIGYGDGDDSTLVPDGTLSVFMRKSFTLSKASDVISAFLYVDYDDAFVAYLNGTEIARANIGTSGVRPAYNETSINIVEPAAASGGLPPVFRIDGTVLASSLHDGENILALEVHNRDATSSDLSSTTFLIAGLSTASSGFRLPPAWFTPPPEITSHLPLLLIDTWGGYIRDEPKIDAWMKLVNNGPGKVNSINDPGTDYDGLIGIEIRGQSSQSFPKKSYGIETRNDLKEDSAVKLIGMPKESDWILTASYSDKTLMRNPLTYYLGNRMGRWQPRTEFCEVYINQEYMGIYSLIEKIKRDKNRVKIAKITPTATSGDSLTGGYIVKVDKLDGLSYNDYFRVTPTVNFSYARHYDYTYVEPKATEIVPEQKTYIKDFLTVMESTLNGSNFKDPVNGFRKYMDEESFAEYEIIQELSNNVDGYRYSTFFYKERDSDGGKLIAGPLWDFDLCYGNVDYSPDRLATNTWLYTNYGTTEGNPMHYWARMMLDPNYKALVKYRYSILRLGPLNTDSIFAWLDSQKAYLGDAIDRNFVKWPILNQYVWPNPYIGYTYDNEHDSLKNWIASRLEWMDSQWLIPMNTNLTELENNDFKVYPNPFNSRFTVVANPLSYEEISLDLYNLQGQKMYSKKYLPEAIKTTQLEVDNPGLPSGIYFLRLSQSGKTIGTSRIVRSEY